MYRRIATEEAFATPALVAKSKRLLEAGGQEPGFAKLGGMIFGDSPGAKVIESMLLDIGDGRLAQMDKDGIGLSILSLTSPGMQVFEASRAAGIASEANDMLAETVRAYPARFASLGAVAPQAPESAASEIERAKKLGLVGRGLPKIG
jgi:5-carboxyvanillate decarboxylase